MGRPNITTTAPLLTFSSRLGLLSPAWLALAPSGQLFFLSFIDFDSFRDTNDTLIINLHLYTAGREVWQQLISTYGSKLEKEGRVHEAALFFLSSNQILEAVNVYLRASLFQFSFICLFLLLLPPHLLFSL